MARTSNLRTYLSDIANSIRAKGNTVEGIRATDFDNAILNLPTGGSIAEFTPEYVSWSGQGSQLGDTLSLSGLNTSKITNMANMFFVCSNLTSLDVSSFNTSNVTNMANMFSYCSSLTSLDVSSFNTSNVTNMFNMFTHCNNLTSLNMSNWDVSNVTNMANMFTYCNNLTSLNMSNSTEESVMRIVNRLPTRTSNNQGVLIVSSDISTDNEAIISSKYWVIRYS